GSIIMSLLSVQDSLARLVAGVLIFTAGLILRSYDKRLDCPIAKTVDFIIRAAFSSPFFLSKLAKGHLGVGVLLLKELRQYRRAFSATVESQDDRLNRIAKIGIRLEIDRDDVTHNKK